MSAYRLVPKSSYKANPKLKYEAPTSFRVEVEEFLQEFYSSCGYTDLLDAESAEKFYAKTEFIKNCTEETEIDILKKLLCERNLLFERDFDILDCRRWEVYRLNHAFADAWDNSNSDMMDIALQQTIDECKLTAASEELLRKAVMNVKSKKYNVKKARSYITSFDMGPLANTQDVDRLQHGIWTCFISNWSYLLWRKNIKVEYERKIKEEHWKMLSETKKRLQRLKNIWHSALDAWNILKKDNQEIQFDVSQLQCAAFLQRCHIDENNILKYSKKMYRNSQNMRETATALLQAIKQCLKIPEHDLWAQLVWLIRIREFFAPNCLFGAEISRICLGLYRPKRGTALLFFRELSQKDLSEIPNLQEVVQQGKTLEDPRWGWIAILQFGMQIADYLKDCFPHGKDYLAITDPYLLQSHVIEHYKDNCAEHYANLVLHIEHGEDRLRAYQNIWDFPWHTIEERQNFLERRLRYVKKYIPVDSLDIWSDYIPVQASPEEKRNAVIQKHIPQLQLFIFENALQDCICNQAQVKLWQLLTAHFLRHL